MYHHASCFIPHHVEACIFILRVVLESVVVRDDQAREKVHPSKVLMSRFVLIKSLRRFVMDETKEDHPSIWLRQVDFGDLTTESDFPATQASPGAFKPLCLNCESFITLLMRYCIKL